LPERAARASSAAIKRPRGNLVTCGCFDAADLKDAKALLAEPIQWPSATVKTAIKGRSDYPSFVIDALHQSWTGCSCRSLRMQLFRHIGTAHPKPSGRTEDGVHFMTKMGPVDVARFSLDLHRDLSVSLRAREPGPPERIDGATALSQ